MQKHKNLLPASAIGEKQELRGLLQDEIIREENGKFYLVLKREESNVYKVNGETGVVVIYLLNRWCECIIYCVLIAVKRKRR